MSSYKIVVPFSQQPKDWFKFIHETLEHDGKYDEIVIDFNQVGFLNTDDFVVLACLIETFYHENCKVLFIGGTDKFNAHLDNIRFKEYWKEGFDRESFTISRNRSTLCLWKICKSRIYSYSQHANDYYRNTFIKGKDLLPLSSNLDEVFNNIFDHSQAEISYIITQYFPQKKKLSFSICDFGIGIPSSINNYRKKNNQKPIEDYDALRTSLELGFSIKSSPRNRGMGLYNIIELTDSSNGSLTMISNNGVLHKEANGMIQMGNSGFNFKGTLIKVVVDTETFEQLDEEDNVYDF